MNAIKKASFAFGLVRRKKCDIVIAIFNPRTLGLERQRLFFRIRKLRYKPLIAGIQFSVGIIILFAGLARRDRYVNRREYEKNQDRDHEQARIHGGQD